MARINIRIKLNIAFRIRNRYVPFGLQRAARNLNSAAVAFQADVVALKIHILQC